MRLRTFIGRSTTEAMAAVRAQLGPEAVIISAQEDGRGNTRVTAALDDNAGGPTVPAADTVIAEALDFHGTNHDLRNRLVDGAAAAMLEDAEDALIAGMANTLRFHPFAESDRVLLLVGAPGSGKTATAAKLATRLVLDGERVRLVSTDLARAGGIAQLAAFAKILRVPFVTVDGPAALGLLVGKADPNEHLIIDTAGVNPFSAADRRDIAAMIGASNAEPVYIYAAGTETNDGSEAAQIFADLGCARTIVTRLDAARRLGSVLTIAVASGLSFAEAGIAGDIADGLTAFTPAFLARLLLPKGP